MPVIEAKKALEKAEPGTIVEVMVDNEIAVQNLKKLADHKGLESVSEKLGEREFVVKITAAQDSRGAGEEAGEKKGRAGGPDGEAAGKKKDHAGGPDGEAAGQEEVSCQPDIRDKSMVVVLPSDQMGRGDETLGRLLMKGFVYALTQQDKLPGTVLLFNGGAKLSCEGSDSLEDLKELQAQGVEILTCGTCLNHFGIGEKLAVGSVTNMYEIVERMTGAGKIVQP